MKLKQSKEIMLSKWQGKHEPRHGKHDGIQPNQGRFLFILFGLQNSNLPSHLI